MTREEAIKTFEEILQLSPTLDETGCSVTEAIKVALSALRPVSREQLDVVINGLKLRLENNEENGVVYIPKFTVEQMIERLEALKDGNTD